MTQWTSGTDQRTAVVYLVTNAILMVVVFVPFLLLDWDVPFLVAVAIILVTAAVVYEIQRRQDPVRVRESWFGWKRAIASLVMLAVAVVIYGVLLLAHT